MNRSIRILVFTLGVIIAWLSPLTAQQSDSYSNDDARYRIYGKPDLSRRDVTFRDIRLLTMRETETPFTLPDYPDRAAWEKKNQYLRTHILVSAGLWPMPEKTPLNAHVFDTITHEDYSVSKVYIETYPGFYLCGNLYRPHGKNGPFPGIVSPHGHWERGRLVDTEVNSVPARGINFAKQGYVIFVYDMIGYNDTRQIGHDFAADSLSNLWGINLLGIQLWNSIRAVDFLTSLPAVDTTRIGVTGASGGGTQTFLLTAVDQRIKVSAPINMLSAQYQGGCLCENAPGLRLNAFNIELGGLAVPRPLLMVSNTQDWTVNTPTTEYPMMQSIYELYDAPEKVRYVQFDFQHNYNQASREAVYAWFSRWLKGEDRGLRIPEQPYQAEDDQDLLVFLNESITDRDLTYQDLADSLYTLPSEGMNASRLKRYLQNQAREQAERAFPNSPGAWNDFVSIYGTAYRHVLAARTPDQVDVKQAETIDNEDHTVSTLLISREEKRDWIPAVLYEPEDNPGAVSVLVSSRGKTGTAEMNTLIPMLVEQGQAVLAIAAFRTGEHVLQAGTETQRDESFTHFTTFNRTDTQERVQDILTALAFAKNRFGHANLNLVGVREAGLWALLAAGLSGELESVIVDANTMNYQDDNALLEHYVPGLMRIGGMQTALALTAGTQLMVYNTGAGWEERTIAEAYRSSNRGGSVAFHSQSWNAQKISNSLTQ
ncbi:MAG TPA: acetylxylan esterase [bacterium]|nr:acetylxylan esterase [bacterium]